MLDLIQRFYACKFLLIGEAISKLAMRSLLKKQMGRNVAISKPQTMKRLHLELLLSIGAKHAEEVDKLSNDIMQWVNR